MSESRPLSTGVRQAEQPGTPACRCLARSIPANRRHYVPHDKACPAHRPPSVGSWPSAPDGRDKGGTRSDEERRKREHAATEQREIDDGRSGQIPAEAEESAQEGARVRADGGARAKAPIEICPIEGRAHRRRVSAEESCFAYADPPSLPSPSVSERAAQSNLNPFAVAFTPNRGLEPEAETYIEPSRLTFDTEELRRFATANCLEVSVDFLLGNVAPGETTKAIASTAALFHVNFLDVNITHPPLLLKTSVGASQMLQLSVKFPVDYSTFKGKEILSGYTLPQVCEAVHESWIRNAKRSILHLSENEDGLDFNLFNVKHPNLLRSIIPRADCLGELIYFNPAKLAIFYDRCATELLLRQLESSE